MTDQQNTREEKPKKDKTTLATVIAIVVLVLIIGSSLLTAHLKGAQIFAKNTATPSPAATVTPSPSPTASPTPLPAPTIHPYSDYGIVKDVYYDTFVKVYNGYIMWYLEDRGADGTDFWLESNIDDIWTGEYTENQILHPGTSMSMSISTIDYNAYLTGVEYVHEEQGDGDIQNDIDIIAALICAIDPDGFDNTASWLDIKNTILKNRSRTAVTNGIVYILDSTDDRISFKISLYESDMTPTPTLKPVPTPVDPELVYLFFITDINRKLSDLFHEMAQLRSNITPGDSDCISAATACARNIQAVCMELINYSGPIPEKEYEIYHEKVIACQLYYQSQEFFINGINSPPGKESANMIERSNELFDQASEHSKRAYDLYMELMRNEGIIE